MDPITVSTRYGTLAVGIGAGPTAAPGHGYLTDHIRPDEAHAFGRSPDAPYLYAFVRSEAGQLTINGIPYTVTYGRFSLREAQYPGEARPGFDWREDRSNGPTLRRDDTWPSDPTDAARKAWREVISPAIVAALRTSAQQCGAAESEARAEFAADCAALATRLRAEADRIAALPDGPQS